MRALAGSHARPAACDAADVSSLAAAIRGHDAVVDLRIAIPPPGRMLFPTARQPYRAVRDGAVDTLVRALTVAGVGCIVHDTVTFVYADGGDAWLAETDAVHARGALGANLACEAHVAQLDCGVALGASASSTVPRTQ